MSAVTTGGDPFSRAAHGARAAHAAPDAAPPPVTNDGRFVVVVPDLALVVATTVGSYGQYAAWRRIREALVPAVMAATN